MTQLKMEEKISETQRKITSSERSKERDAAVKKSVDAECERFVASAKTQTGLRQDQMTQLKMGIKLLETMSAGFLQTDLDNVTQAVVSFVQTGMKTQMKNGQEISAFDFEPANSGV